MTKKKNTRKKSPQKECSKCNKSKFVKSDFYMSNSDKHSDGRLNVCKKCILDELNTKEKDIEELTSEIFLKNLHDVLLSMNRPYIHDVWLYSLREAQNRNFEFFGAYLKNLLLNHRDKDWRDSVFEGEGEITENDVLPKDKKRSRVELKLDTKNEEDVLRLLGYDPFQFESKHDKPNLFNKLIDYLDESTMEDGFKLTSVIEIVRTFNQIDKINAALSDILSGSFSKNTGNVTSLIGAKDKMLKSTLDIAKENGISVKHSTNKSKGAGTLSGILKKLQEHDIHEVDVNLFDINTSEGMKQVADFSNDNIMKQLQFDENDMSSMLQEQREMLTEQTEKANKLEEDNRKLRVEVDKNHKEEKALKEKINEMKEEIRLLED